MAGHFENGSLPVQPFSDAQASILDFLFPGFTRMSAAVQGYLTIELERLYSSALFLCVVYIRLRTCLQLLFWIA